MDDEGQTPFETYALAELRRMSAVLAGMAKQVTEIHAELEEFRPVLAAFKPGNGTSDLQRAGMLRAMRKAAKGGPS